MCGGGGQNIGGVCGEGQARGGRRGGEGAACLRGGCTSEVGRMHACVARVMVAFFFNMKD